MSHEHAPLVVDDEDLFEEAPCGYLATRMDGTIVRVNRTFERWTGRDRTTLLERARFQDLLTPGGRIYYETHLGPLLHVEGRLSEVALDILGADGARLPALVSAVVGGGGDAPKLVRTTVFDATERRRYERDLVELRRREHEIAAKLQRSLLAGELPVEPGLEVEVKYRPAFAGLEVGGDWYDAFWVEERRKVVVAVGDVVGRGIDAAASMGQIRSALRALAAVASGPAHVLSALDDYCERHRVGQMTTLAVVELDVRTGSLRYACAGHPPPILLPAGESARLLSGGRSLPLGAAVGPPVARADATDQMPHGSVLVLYSDGLVETRREAITDGIAHLVTRLDGASRAAVSVADAIGPLIAESAEHDDVCVVVLGLTGEAGSGRVSGR